MWIQDLNVQHCRIIENAELELSPTLNLIIGDNGSGKSSLLEAIYLLSRGRSFRTSRIAELISHQAESVLCSAKLFKQTNSINTSPTPPATTIGIDKSPKHTRIRINKQDIKTQAELTRALPVTLIHPEAVTLVTGSPKLRRAFIDWIAFYIDVNFYDVWKHYQRVLKQRNACLRNPSQRSALPYWTQELIKLQHPLQEQRLQALQYLMASIEHYQRMLWLDANLDLELGNGFPANTLFEDEVELATIFTERESLDIKFGNTFYGVHRADLVIKINGELASRSASRGQLKLLSTLLLLSQSRCISNQYAGKGIIAIDDLAAELDAENRQRLLDVLLETKQQLFITSTHKQQSLFDANIHSSSMFHVKHGRFSKVIR